MAKKMAKKRAKRLKRGGRGVKTDEQAVDKKGVGLRT